VIREKERLICSFLRPEICERVFYELNSSKKRQNGLSRFCHRAQQTIMTSKIVARCSLSDVKSLLAYLQETSNAEKGYFIGFSPLDGTECPLEQALNEGLSSGMGFAVLLDDGMLLLREEQQYSAPDVFLLRN